MPKLKDKIWIRLISYNHLSLSHIVTVFWPLPTDDSLAGVVAGLLSLHLIDQIERDH